MKNLKPQITPTVDASQVRQGFNEVKDAAADAAQAIARSGEQAAQGVGKIGDGAAGAADKIEKADNRIVASLQRRIALAETAGKGERAYQEQLLRNRGLNVDLYAPYLDQLSAIEKAHQTASGTLNNMGISAKQTAAAMRGVPAQFTDIITSLQGGQEPMTVLLQQGGQLKDMFGGIGNASRALGTYVLGLVNPFTLAAAAAGGLAYAYNQGATEAQEFRKTVILSGQAAGVTAGQLSDMARAVKESGAGTQGRAAEILNAMAGSAKVGAENMGRFTAAALRLEAVGGPAAEETAKAFADLAKDPLQAALKLNEGVNFLTTSVYKQIKALDEQGRTVEAAKVAQVAYFEAVNGMTPALLQNLGYVERAWLGIKEAAKLAFDAVASVGRDMGPDAQAKALRNRIASVEAGNEGQSGRALLPELRASLELMAKANFLESERAAAIGDQAQARKDFVKWTEDGGKLLDKEDQKRKELIRVETQGRRLILAGLLTEQELRDRLAATRAKYADKSPGAKPLVNPLDVEAMRAYAKSIDDFGRIAVQASAKADGLSKTQERLREIQGDPAWQTYSRQQQEQIIFSASLSQAEETRAAITDRAAKATAEAAKASAQWMDELRKGADTIEQQSDKLLVEAKAQLLVVDGYRSLEQAIHLVEIARLRERQAKLQDGEDAAVLAIQREIDARQQLIDQIGQRDRRKASADEAKKAAEDWKKTAEQINDTLTDALLRGFESGKGFARNLRDTVVNMFKTMVLRPVVSAIVSPVSQAITGSLGLSGLANAAGTAGGVNALGGIGGLAGIGASLGAFGTAAGYGASALFGGTGLTALTGGASMVGAGSIASGLGMMAGVLGPIAAGLAVVTNLLKDKSATLGYGSSTSTGDAAGRLFVFGRGNDSGAQDSLAGMARAIVTSVADTAKALGGQITSDLAIQIASDIDRTGKASGIIGITRSGALAGGVQTGGTDPNAVAATKIAADQLGAFFTDATSAAIIAGLQQSDLPARFADYFGSVATSSLSKEQADKILVTAAAAQQLGTEFERLGGAFAQLDNISVAASEQLLAVFGGLDAFRAATSSYVQNFYSESEQAAIATQQLTGELGKLGLSMPATRDAYRALVDAQDLTTESGRNAYAALLNLSPAFAQLIGATQEVADATDEAAARMIEAGRQALAGLAEQSAGLQAELLRAQGDVAGAAALERQTALAGILSGLSAVDSAAATAAYDYNLALQQQIDTLLSAKSAAEAAAQAEQQRADQAIQLAAQQAEAIAAQRYGLEGQLLQAQGNTAAIRERELAALDASNRSIQEQIYALQDQEAALQASAVAAQAAERAAQDAAAAIQSAAEAEARRAEAIASERYGLEGQLLQAQGDTAGIRARELAALDASNRAIQEQIYALQDRTAAEQQAAQATAAAAEQAAQALARVTNALDELAGTRIDLQAQLLQLRGDTAGAAALTRDRDLARLTAGVSADEAARITAAYDYNTALRDQIKALQDSQSAAQALAQEQAQAAQQAAQAAQAITQAWQSVTDGIFGEVQRIRDLMAGGDSPASLAQAQARFGIASAQARAGDQEAAKQLPALSQALLSMAEAQAGSFLDVQRLRGQIAGSLQGTGDRLANQYALVAPLSSSRTTQDSEARAAELVAEVQQLRDDNRAQASALAALQLRWLKVVESWESNGMPGTRSEV